MSGVQKCVTDRKYAACSGETGVKLARDWFGMTPEQIEAAAGRFKRGKYTGKLRGWIVWESVRVGGWDFGRRCVLRPGMMYAVFCATYDGYRHAMICPGSQFIGLGAVRVDTAYGHAPDVANQT